MGQVTDRIPWWLTMILVWFVAIAAFTVAVLGVVWLIVWILGVWV